MLSTPLDCGAPPPPPSTTCHGLPCEDRDAEAQKFSNRRHGSSVGAVPHYSCHNDQNQIHCASSPILGNHVWETRRMWARTDKPPDYKACSSPFSPRPLAPHSIEVAHTELSHITDLSFLDRHIALSFIPYLTSRERWTPRSRHIPRTTIYPCLSSRSPHSHAHTPLKGVLVASFSTLRELQ